MIVNMQQVQRGIINFIDNELGQKAIGINKFAIYFMLPQIPNKISNLYGTYKNNPMFKDFFIENGDVDLDKLYATTKEAIRKSGQVEYMGIIFNESDVDKLYNYIKNTQI